MIAKLTLTVFLALAVAAAPAPLAAHEGGNATAASTSKAAAHAPVPDGNRGHPDDPFTCSPTCAAGLSTGNSTERPADRHTAAYGMLPGSALRAWQVPPEQPPPVA